MKSDTLTLLKKLSPVLNKIKLVHLFERVRQHHDEPKFWYYSASISDKYLQHDGKHFHSTASGVSFFSQEEAALKAMSEAIERYNNFAFFTDCVEYTGNYLEIKKNAIDPKKLIFFSEEQLKKKEYKEFRIDDNSSFRWTKIKSLIDKKDYYIPCQSIYLSCKPAKNEPILYPAISTGAAGHFTLEEAILCGIYEVVERDAFMIYYLNKLKPKRYDLNSLSDKKIKTFLEIGERYNLEIISLDITTDLNVPVVASVIIDRSGLSKAVSVGLKSHLEVEKAIIGSINEAFHTRTWIRESYIDNPKKLNKSELLEDSSIKNRGLFWYPIESISKLDFFIKNLDISKIKNKENNLPVKIQLSEVRKRLESKGYEIYYKDITSKYFGNLPFKVVKVVIPDMHPLYLNEKYPLMGGKRLHEVPGELGYKKTEKLNRYPHPFL